MKAKLLTQDGKVKGDIQLPDSLFGAEINEHLLFVVLKTYRANQRQGTAKTKTRAEVSGGGKKPWKQKGNGRARSGSNTSPIWVRGSKAHGPQPRDYYSAIPRKMRVLALASALSSRAADEKIMVLNGITCPAQKTVEIVNMLKALSISNKRNLLLLNKDESIVYRCGRNIKNLDIKLVHELNAYDVLRNENIIFGSELSISTLTQVVG